MMILWRLKVLSGPSLIYGPAMHDDDEDYHHYDDYNEDDHHDD